MRRDLLNWPGGVLAVIAVVATTGTAAAQYRGDAVPGEPFGVGKLEVRLPEGQYSPALGVEGLKISESNGRVLYPVIERREIPGVITDTLKGSGRPIGQLIGGLLDRPPTAVIHFLFRGSEPLDLTIESTRVDRLALRTRSNPRLYDRLFREWWREYTDQPGLLETKDDYPPIVQNYMATTIARQLGLEPPAPPEPGLLSKGLDEQVRLSLASESVKIGFEHRRILGDPAYQERADRRLPEPIQPVTAPVPPAPDNLEIEPIAMRVPIECVYIRFGTFANFLWLQDTLKKWGGDAQNLLSLRGLDYGMSARIEEGIVLKQSALARLFGGTVITDVAIVGTDVYFQDGASFGLLFHARNNFLLANDFNGQRAERLKTDKTVTEETVQIAGRDVSFLSSPDGRVRSFYAAAGDFHFVTRSHRLMERFLETSDAEETSLGASAAFRHARQRMPVDRDDTVFVYMSESFFDNLISPAYRIETVRRLQAIADIELIHLARLAAQGDGVEADTVASLVEAGYLPPEFGVRPDGSEAVWDGDGIFDSARGQRGALLPILDMPVEAVTPTEAATYRQFVDYYHRNWGNLDPVVVAIQRTAKGKGLEQVTIDAKMMPFSQENFDRLQQRVGVADTWTFAPIEGNIATFEAVLSSQRIFGGLQDGLPAGDGSSPAAIFRNLLAGYLGADGPLGPLRLLNFGVFSAPDAAGFSRSMLGGWRLSTGTYTLFSFQRHVLANVASQLQYIETEEPAQLRIDVDDVAGAKITPLLNRLGYGRTLETSRGNLRLLHALNQQLGVPLAECRDVAQTILDANLICPLGGEYELKEAPSGVRYWTSTALTAPGRGGPLGASAPPDYVAPPLNWFRGLTGRVQVLPQTLNVHAEILMQESNL